MISGLRLTWRGSTFFIVSRPDLNLSFPLLARDTEKVIPYFRPQFFFSSLTVGIKVLNHGAVGRVTESACHLGQVLRKVADIH